MSDEPTIEQRIAELRETERQIAEGDAVIAQAQARRAAAAGRATEARVNLYETTLRETLAAHGVDGETAEALVRARPTSAEEIAREARIDEQRAARPAPAPTLTIEQREAHEAAVRDRLRAGGMAPAEIDAMMAARPTAHVREAGVMRPATIRPGLPEEARAVELFEDVATRAGVAADRVRQIIREHVRDAATLTTVTGLPTAELVAWCNAQTV